MNQYIDHTLLKQNATKEQITQLCKEAMEYEFASVCVNSCWVKYCKNLLQHSKVMVCTVIGFPLGATTSATKAFEAREAIENGADEIDMVINIGALLDDDIDYVIKDIAAVVEVAKGKCVKVIIETCLLTDEQKVKACQASVKANATFVKTSTGFSTNGATIEDVRLMKQTVAGKCLVKAAGGVRSYDDLVNMIQAGADRIGTSSGIKLLQKQENKDSY